MVSLFEIINLLLSCSTSLTHSIWCSAKSQSLFVLPRRAPLPRAQPLLCRGQYPRIASASWLSHTDPPLYLAIFYFTNKQRCERAAHPMICQSANDARKGACRRVVCKHGPNANTSSLRQTHRRPVCNPVTTLARAMATARRTRGPSSTLPHRTVLVWRRKRVICGAAQLGACEQYAWLTE